MRDAAFAEVNLLNSRLGTLEMNDSKFTGKTFLDKLEVQGSILIRRSIFDDRVDLTFTTIGLSLDISGSTFPSLDLTSARIAGDLRLGAKDRPPKWERRNNDPTKIILRNTEVGALQDLEDSWPEEIEIVGFGYSRLGGLADDIRLSMANRSVLWMKEWLNKQKTYSPQPYEQLSKVLKKMGYKSKAIDILFAGKERERKEETKWINKINLFFQLLDYSQTKPHWCII